MPLVQIGVKVDPSIKDRIKRQIDGNKFRDFSDFVIRAILDKLEREEAGINIEEKLGNLEEEIARIQDTLRDMNIRLSKLE